MNHVRFTVVLFFVVYAGLLALFVGAARGARPAEVPVTWYVWAGLGALCLATIALEITLLVIWSWMKVRGISADAGVPRRLGEEERRLLEERRPAIALLMPAHGEASTEEDRAALVERILGTVLKTPGYCTFFLLCDSAEDQSENERGVIEAVRGRLRGMGREGDAGRVHLEEYRDKPAEWRHKCGSILRWIQGHGARYEFMFVLDADSSLMEEDPTRPATCDVVMRMAVPMLRDESLAMVQAAMVIKKYSSAWGWVQSVNARVGVRYYVPLFSYIYGRNTPCYGHNCLFRVRAFAAHCRNTLHYTSHDHMDAADLAAAGMGCVMTDAALTYEEPEDDVLLWLKRECRWSRGNGQWFTYLFRKRGLPAGAMVFLVAGIAQYLWAVLAAGFFFAAVSLVPGGAGQELVTRVSSTPGRVLIGIVMGALFLPRLLAYPNVRAFVGTTAVALVIGPAVMIWQGMSFLLGAFGTGWIPRGARASAFDAGQALRIARTLAPIAVVGVLLWRPAWDAPADTWAGALMHLTIAGMVVSPVAGVLLSWPLGRGAEREVAAGVGRGASAAAT
jgi:hypothetical protein